MEQDFECAGDCRVCHKPLDFHDMGKCEVCGGIFHSDGCGGWKRNVYVCENCKEEEGE